MDLKDIRHLIDLLIEKDVAEFEIEQHGIRMRVRRGAEPIHVPGPVVQASPTQALTEPVTVEQAETGMSQAPPNTHVIRSPMVGTFYRAAEPAGDPFVAVGDMVEEGQTVCIIEAMKLMNEIGSDASGEVVAVLVENSQQVEYGQELLAIKPQS